MTHVYTRAPEKSHSNSQIPATQQEKRKPQAPVGVGLTERQQKIAEAAYLRAEHRGFLPGCELKDWLEAEGEVDNVLLQGS